MLMLVNAIRFFSLKTLMNHEREGVKEERNFGLLHAISGKSEQEKPSFFFRAQVQVQVRVVEPSSSRKYLNLLPPRLVCTLLVLRYHDILNTSTCGTYNEYQYLY